MKLYIAGPMSGIPQYNFPAFFAVGDKLRELGYEVVNPAEIDTKEDKGAALASPDGLGHTGTKTWGDFLMRDVKLVADVVDGIFVLPNWFKSRGARLETFVALQVQKPVYDTISDDFGGGSLVEIDPIEAIEMIAYNTVNQGDVSRYDHMQVAAKRK